MPQNIPLSDIVYALIILAATGLVAWLFYWRVRRVLHALADNTKTVLDDFLVRSIRWPVFAGIVLTGIYFAVLLFPFSESIATALARGLHIVFLALAGWAVASVLDSVYRWYKLEVASKTRTALDDWITALLRGFTPLAVAFLVAISSLAIFDISTTPVLDWLLSRGSRIGLIILLSIFLIFILGRVLPPAVSRLVYRQAPTQTEDECRKRADTLSGFLVTTAQVFIIGIAAFMILSELAINITPILTGVGVAGIAIGFGAQTLVKDYLSGLFVILENQYRVGDVVTVAGISGLVEQIDLRRTVLRDLDGIQHVISNGEIRVASNFTKEVSRVNLNISVSYATDLDHAIKVINRVCAEMAADPAWAPLIVKAPSFLRVDNLGDSGIDLKITGDTKPIQQWSVMGELRRRIKKTFDEERIEIPWPHTKVYFGNWPPSDETNKTNV